MLTAKRITPIMDDLDKVKNLMITAFPEDELKPFKCLFDKTELDGYDFLAFYNEDDNFVGLSYVVTKDDLAYLFWLAVDESARCNGIGSKILSELNKIYKDYRIILDIERINDTAPNNEQRIRRKKFYKRNGFIESSLRYDLYNVEYEILINHDDVGRKEFEDAYSYILDKELKLNYID